MKFSSSFVNIILTLDCDIESEASYRLNAGNFF